MEKVEGYYLGWKKEGVAAIFDVDEPGVPLIRK
jgi:hypothetical protein